jgi:hypothetical protein
MQRQFVIGGHVKKDTYEGGIPGPDTLYSCSQHTLILQ